MGLQSKLDSHSAQLFGPWVGLAFLSGLLLPLSEAPSGAEDRRKWAWSSQAAVLEGTEWSRWVMGVKGSQGAGTVGDLDVRRIKMRQHGGHGTLLQYSCLENPMDGGAW